MLLVNSARIFLSNWQTCPTTICLFNWKIDNLATITYVLQDLTRFTQPWRRMVSNSSTMLRSLLIVTVFRCVKVLMDFHKTIIYTCYDKLKSQRLYVPDPEFFSRIMYSINHATTEQPEQSQSPTRGASDSYLEPWIRLDLLL